MNPKNVNLQRKVKVWSRGGADTLPRPPSVSPRGTRILGNDKIHCMYYNADRVATTVKPAPQSSTSAHATPTGTVVTTSPTPTPTHAVVKRFLKHLANTEMRSVGVTLGLSYTRLKNFREESVLDDTISSWLRKDDDVTETSWQKLVEALQEAGHTGVAANIRGIIAHVLAYDIYCCIPYVTQKCCRESQGREVKTKLSYCLMIFLIILHVSQARSKAFLTHYFA